MSTWLIYALICPFLWCLSNILDQFVVRYFTGSSTLIPFTLVALTAAPFMVIGFFISPNIFSYSTMQIAAVLGCSALFMAAVYPYLIALKSDDASTAIPIFQLIPVLVYLLGWVLLGEKLSALQLLGGGLIIFSAVAVTIDWQHFKPRWRVLGLMALSSLGFASYTILVRSYAAEIDSWSFITLMTTGWVLIGLILLFTNAARRNELFTKIKASRGRLLIYGVVQEAQDIISQKFAIMALALAPTAVHVQLVGGLQAILIVILAALFGWLLPKQFEKQKFDRIMIYKIACGGIMLAGLALLLGV